MVDLSINQTMSRTLLTGGSVMFALLVIGGLNTAISLFYYLRVVKTMTIDPEPEHRAPVSFSMISVEGVYVALVTLPVLLLGIWFDTLLRWAQAAAGGLL